MTVRAAGNSNNPPANVAPTGLEFHITDKKIVRSVVILSKENNKKLLEQLKSLFKKTVKWNKYRLQITTQSNNNNLNYLLDPTSAKGNSYLFFHWKEFKKTMLKKIIEILFHVIMYQTRNKKC